MEILLFVLILVSLVAYLLFKLNYKKTKKPTIKKHEIVEQYKNELRNILTIHENNKEKQLHEKKQFLQKCNSELSRNIFFTQIESKQIIQQLAQL